MEARNQDRASWRFSLHAMKKVLPSWNSQEPHCEQGSAMVQADPLPPPPPPPPRITHAQTESLFFKAPLEIRQLIYGHYIGSTQPNLHVYTKPDHSLGVCACITDHGAIDGELQSALDELWQASGAKEEDLVHLNSPLWSKRLKSPWVNHWRCREALLDDPESMTPGRFLGGMLSCRRIYEELKAIMPSGPRGYVFTDTETIGNVFGVFRPRSILSAKSYLVSVDLGIHLGLDYIYSRKAKEAWEKAKALLMPVTPTALESIHIRCNGSLPRMPGPFWDYRAVLWYTWTNGIPTSCRDTRVTLNLPVSEEEEGEAVRSRCNRVWPHQHVSVSLMGRPRYVATGLSDEVVRFKNGFVCPENPRRSLPGFVVPVSQSG